MIFTRPWVFQQRVYVLLAAELFIYVDDWQLIGTTKDL